VLSDRPLALAEDGPTLTITDGDVAIYKADAADKQSVVPVAAGERLTEFQALEALLVPSGNNIAETLARWDAGSSAAFVAKMNQTAAALHLDSTAFADPAGVSVRTVSTPADLLALGMAAMKQEVFAQIVSLPQTTLPVAGILYNVNSALGESGIIGIKTGSGLDSGANFLFAATVTIDSSQVILYGCVMGQPTLDAAFREAETLIGAMQGSLRVREVANPKQAVGSYVSAWGSKADLVPTTSAALVEWPGMILRQRLEAPILSANRLVAGGSPAGRLHVALGDQQVDLPLVTSEAIEPPGFAWRLLRIGG
jgi:D-alanyl-D-alanine carboxypeptidase (penicillin-binding protein 5/6)